MNKLAKIRGFTLIELMIVVAIVAILAGIAYPAYTQFLQDGYRAQGQAFLLDVAQRQQNYLIVHRTYALGLEELGFTDASGTLNLGAELEDLNAQYDIVGLDMQVVETPPPSFNITISPRSGSMQEGDGSLCLANSGVRGRFCGGNGQVPW